jgi:hypothetical protein
MFVLEHIFPLVVVLVDKVDMAHINMLVVPLVFTLVVFVEVVLVLIALNGVMEIVEQTEHQESFALAVKILLSIALVQQSVETVALVLDM